MKYAKLATLGLALTVSACYHGRLDDADGDDGEGDDPNGPLCSSDTANEPGRRTLRRMTRDEYESSVRDVFGLDEAAWSGPLLNADPSVEGFNNNAAHLLVDDTYADNLYRTAEGVGAAVSDPSGLTTRLPCASEASRACAENFLDRYGRRLFRRPLTSTERDRYLALHDEAAADEGFERGIHWMTVALVQSPNFVYRSELGRPDGEGRYVLEPYEIATALAYTYEGTAPSEALLVAAESGALDDRDGVEAIARALVLDDDGAVKPGFRARFSTFARQWLNLAKLPNLEKDPSVYPDFTPAVRASMQAETERYLASVVFDEHGGVADLLTSTHTYLDQTLAEYYGYGEVTGDGFVEVERPAEYGIGLLAQGSLMAVTAHNRSTSPTQRGLAVREKFLCSSPPPPPPGVAEIPEPTPDMTTRERYEAHTSRQACKGCHEYMDLIGFGFEHLDADGRYRAREGAFEIDDSGRIALLNGEPVAFEGSTQLALSLAELEETSHCVAEHMAAFAYGVNARDAACMVSDASSALATGDLSLIDYYVALATTPHFLTRRD